MLLLPQLLLFSLLVAGSLTKREVARRNTISQIVVLGQPTQAISVLSSSYLSHNAVDGNVKTCAHSKSPVYNPWWTVRLPYRACLHHVVLTAYPDSNGKEALTVGAIDESPTAGQTLNPQSYQHCADVKFTSFFNVTYNCSPGCIKGNYVVVQNMAKGYVSLCEIQVFVGEDETTTVVPTTIAPASCPSGFVQLRDLPGLCYLFAGNFLLNWFDALAHCRMFKADLLYIMDEHEHFTLVRHIRSDYSLRNLSFWTGGNDIAETWRFVWSATHTSFPYANWAGGQPDGGEHCMGISNRGGYRWYDITCDTKLGYICKRKP